jgi:hypothetical protein
MLSLDDQRWKLLKGGYRVAFDATRALRELLDRGSGQAAWDELWQNLHHQGDVDTASYAAVPHLVRVIEAAGEIDWNGYALIATIEIERHRGRNPPLPDWLAAEYKAAWDLLLPLALRDFPRADNALAAQAILGVLALCKGLRAIGEIVSHFDESEIDEILRDDD